MAIWSPWEMLVWFCKMQTFLHFIDICLLVLDKLWRSISNNAIYIVAIGKGRHVSCTPTHLSFWWKKKFQQYLDLVSLELCTNFHGQLWTHQFFNVGNKLFKAIYGYLKVCMNMKWLLNLLQPFCNYWWDLKNLIAPLQCDLFTNKAIDHSYPSFFDFLQSTCIPSKTSHPLCPHCPYQQPFSFSLIDVWQVDWSKGGHGRTGKEWEEW